MLDNGVLGSPRQLDLRARMDRALGTCPAKATVTEYLQAYWCDISGCRFITVSSGQADVYAGAAGHRADANTRSSTNRARSAPRAKVRRYA